MPGLMASEHSAAASLCNNMGMSPDLEWNQVLILSKTKFAW